MTPRTKEQNEEIRLRRLAQIRRAAADVFLDKGPLLEIRDVAAQAGLGYGTVYHYYSNKGDLLNDLLWDALERAEGWPEVPLEEPSKALSEVRLKVPLEKSPKALSEAPLEVPSEALLRKVPLEVQLNTLLDKAPRASASREVTAGGFLGLAAAVDTGNQAAADAQSDSSGETVAAAELGPIAAAGVRLLQLWAEDHALYLLYKLAGEGFASLPEGRGASLSAAFRREVLAPLAALLETGLAAEASAAPGENTAEPPSRLLHAEMLLAALVGCASLSLRRGKLHEEARDIALFLKL